MEKGIKDIIALAKSAGYITQKQKEFILNKARRTGEDVDEIEMMLESIPLEHERTKELYKQAKVEKIRKCPHCGAVISETLFTCPECGYALQTENMSSEDARMELKKLQDMLNRASDQKLKWYEQDLRDHQQSTIIRSFTIPNTKEGLLLMLEFAFSNYASLEDDDKEIKNAWHSKIMQAMDTLGRIGKDDAEVKQAISVYQSKLEKTEKRDKKNKTKSNLLFIGLIIAFIFIPVLLELLGIIE